MVPSCWIGRVSAATASCGAGALVPPDREIPDGTVVMGVPGRAVRAVTEADLAMIAKSARRTTASAYAAIAPACSRNRG